MSASNPGTELLLGVRRTIAACVQDRAVLVGELSFTAGWSLLWASSLEITSYVPTALCIALMAIGLGLPGWRHFRSRAPSGQSAKISTAALTSATKRDEPLTRDGLTN